MTVKRLRNGTGKWHLAPFVLLALVAFAHAKESSSSTPSEDETRLLLHTIDRGKNSLVESAQPSTTSQSSSSSLSSRPHARYRRQLFDGFRFSDLFRVFNTGTLEGVDSMLRSTRNLDVFQCLERISCEMAAPLRTSEFEQEEVLQEEVLDQPGIPAVQPQFQQPVFLTPQQIPQFVTPGFQIVPQQIVPVGQPGVQQFVQQPGAQFVQQQPIQQFAQHRPVQQFAQQPIQQAFRHTPHGQHGHGGGFHHEGAIKRIDESEEGVQREREDNSFFAFYRELVRNSQQEGGFLYRLSKLFNFNRKKREAPNPFESVRKKRNASSPESAKEGPLDSEGKDEVLERRKRGVMDTIQRLWGGREFVGVLDRMMEGTDDSLYPYTRAALMGYTGTPETCEELYPECPTSMDELINTFNNLRRYFPNGIPFRDRLPIPIRYLVP